MGIRKQRDTSYSMTQRLIKTLGIEEVEKMWQKLGMYKASIELSRRMQNYVSPYVLRYMSNKFYWKRPVNPKSAIFVGVRRGTVLSSYYKHLIFPEEKDENVTI
jgi:hypothetical protein